MRIRKVLFCGVVLILATFFMFSLSTAKDLTLKDVDLVSMGAGVRDGVLKISVFYQNRDQDKLVFWEKGKVRCECQVYEDVGKEEKGQKIMAIKKELKRGTQTFYGDVPKNYLGKKAIIECSINTGYKKFNVSKATSLD